MDYQTIILTIEERIAVVRINRPDKLNALNALCKQELGTLFAKLKNDPAVDVVILTGTGEKAFVAGTDIGELALLNAESGREFALGGQSVFDLIQHLGKPVIAAVNGYALGGGCELALACHFRVCSQNAKFGQPEVNLGVIPGYGGTQRLARVVGIGCATEMILTGRSIDAQEALRIGLVSSVVPLAELLPAAESIARAILAKGQLAIRMSLKALNAALEMPLSEGLKVEAALFGECCSTEDSKEGINAFLQKRKPSFKGK
jgi:enoyl-CoA hydratase